MLCTHYPNSFFLCESSFADTDSEKEGCSDTESISETDSDGETPTEMRQLLGLVRYLIPVVGPSVWVLKLGCCPMLSNGLVSKKTAIMIFKGIIAILTVKGSLISILCIL